MLDVGSGNEVGLEEGRVQSHESEISGGTRTRGGRRPKRGDVQPGLAGGLPIKDMSTDHNAFPAMGLNLLVVPLAFPGLVDQRERRPLARAITDVDRHVHFDRDHAAVAR
jgi:hypothetical protein